MTTKPVTVLKKNDPIMLKQQILFLQSELARYANQVKDYQNNYHYSMIKKLKEENAQLKEELRIFQEKKVEEMESLQTENEQLKQKLTHFDGNSESFIADLLNEKEEYMEKWELLKEELQKVILDQASMQNAEEINSTSHVEETDEIDKKAEKSIPIEEEQHNHTDEDSGTEWFLNNIRAIKKE